MWGGGVPPMGAHVPVPVPIPGMPVRMVPGMVMMPGVAPSMVTMQRGVAVIKPQTIAEPSPEPAPSVHVTRTDAGWDADSDKLNTQTTPKYNFNPLLAQNILCSDYYRNTLSSKDFHGCVDELVQHVNHVEAFNIGHNRIPSSAFCLLYRLCTLKLNQAQVQELIDHRDSPFIRAIGFLLLRFLCASTDVWEWLRDYVDDPEEFVPFGDRKKRTMGEFVRKIATEQEYGGTRFPRIPVPKQRAIKKELLLAEMHAEKMAKMEKYRDRFTEGLVCMGQFYEDKQWYKVRIDKVDSNGKFRVTFLEYGNQEEVDLAGLKLLPPTKKSDDGDNQEATADGEGEAGANKKDVIDLAAGELEDGEEPRGSSSTSGSGRVKRRRSTSKESTRRSRDRSDRRVKRRTEKGSMHRRSRSPSEEVDIDALLLKKEREKAQASGRDYGRRPTSYKTSLSLELQTSTNRRRSRTPPPRRRESKREDTRRSGSRVKRRSDRERDRKRSHTSDSKSSSRLKLSAEALERQRKLRARYG